ncbi:MAG: 2-C-methyl-D-erythritol 4-phosphate cytidylyltransferase [bacterium]|nr:2-C-methyl-D-erythritol 4-phosphate cytidylyltransferase [Candidatus Margulisiibacteriota bacterium]
MTNVAIITAGGSGKRMGQPKQFLEVGGVPILKRTISVFEESKVVDQIIVVVNEEDIERVKDFGFRKVLAVVAAGLERQDSVANGLKALPDEAEIVLIHDGARPFIGVGIIERAVAKALQTGAVVVGVPVKDTVKRMKNVECGMKNEGIIILETVDRGKLWAAQTPQVFRKDIIVKAFARFGQEKVTDDAMLVEKSGIPVTMVMGSYQNIKITTPEDIIFAQALIKA